MALKEKDPIIMALSSSKRSSYQSGFSKIALNTQITDSSQLYSIFSIIIVILLFIAYCIAIKPTTIMSIEKLITFIPMVILTLPIIFLITPPPILLYQFDLYFIKAGIDMDRIPMPEKKSDHVNIATRLLHPRYQVPMQQDDIFLWLNSYAMRGFKINVLRVLLSHYFANTEYFSKLAVSLNLHRVQLLTYFILLFFTAFVAHYLDYKLDLSHKYSLGIGGLTWFVLSVALYKKQIKKLNYWLNKSHRQYLSINFPLFIWNDQYCSWQELRTDEIYNPIYGQYGLDTEKIIALTQGILLALHLTILKLL